MAQFSLKGRTALVTGGSRGCGLAFAEGLAEAGADVAIFDIISPSDAFNTIKDRFGIKTAYFNVDVSSAPALESGFASLAASFSPTLDICVACAGINKNIPFLSTTAADLSQLLAVNVFGAYMTAQHAARTMLANEPPRGRGGSIVLVASIAARGAIRTQSSSAYCGTKGAVAAMVAPMAAELAPMGIRVNSLSPGYVRTEMTGPFPDLLARWGEDIMVGRVAETEDLKGACVFLAGDGSKYMTGHDLCIDGGVTKW
ncbi:putative lung carbonyl reductase [Lineolata rhizophorae]|uniref:Putative lung carbonyl reductase n=1 Tax=Lineolata rhizophorae TaxID=578093 RepID=A0A6A6P8E2_9PEZI|nr:putative lung carbonyl reductase [Lineolata rhizophorae]